MQIAAIAWWLPVGAPCLASPSPPADALPLAPEAAISREMAAGETHDYHAELRQGEYLQVDLDQQGVDVTATVFGPDGAVLLETDSPNGPMGPEPVALVAGAAGMHRLRLKAGEIAIPPRGRYRIHGQVHAEPSALHRLRVDAVRAGAGGAATWSRDPRAARAHFAQAAVLWRQLGDPRMALWAQALVGYADAFSFDQPRQALDSYEPALAAAKELGDEFAEARLSDALAQVVFRLGRIEETRALMERALELHRAAGRNGGVARGLTVLGSFFSVTGEPRQALDRLYDALSIYEAAADAQNVARTRFEIGAAYLRLGEPGLALEQFRLALPEFARDPFRRARCITETGVARFRIGDLEGAREAYTEARAIYATLDNRISEADTLLGLGDVLRAEGRPRDAVGAFEAALGTYRSREYAYGTANALCRLGETSLALGDLDAARVRFTDTLAFGDAAGAAALGCAELGLARVEAAAGALQSAEGHARAAVARLEGLRNVASDRARLSAVAWRHTAYETLVNVLMRAHEERPQAGHDAAALEASERAQARGLLDLLAEGRLDVSEGADPALVAQERSIRHRLNAAAAAHASALARRSADAEDRAREVDSLVARLDEAQARRRRASPRYAALAPAEPLTLAQIRAQVLDADTQLVQYALGAERSFAWVVSADRLHAVRLAPRAEIEDAVRRLHRALSGGAGTGARPAAEAARRDVARMLVEPLLPALTAPRLLVVAPGALQYVPLASLPQADGTSLLDRFEIVGAPSASVVGMMRSGAPRRVPPRTVAVFADPVFEASDPRLGGRRPDPPRLAGPPAADRAAVDRALRAPDGRAESLARLPFSRQEAEAIVRLAPDTAFLATGFEARREVAVSPLLSGYRIVHFATHAVVNDERPELSGVVLSRYDREARPQDGFVRLHDVYALRLNADLAVLSGCRTALGREIAGEGLVGLTRGFLFAGARSVVASLWPVDDESTAELMARFYRGLLKERRPAADALRQAQREMSATRRWSAPFHWAGFVLQGDWR